MQLSPFVSQRDHAYANEVGLPSQVPFERLHGLADEGGSRNRGRVRVDGSEAVEVALPSWLVLAVVVVVVTGLVSQDLTTFTCGSPKMELLQSTPPVKVLGLVNVPFAP